jgi:pyruvate,water dikinase
MTYYGLLIKSSEKRGISKEDILIELSDIGDLRGSNQIKKIIEISNLAKKNKDVRDNLLKSDYEKTLFEIKNDEKLSENIKDYFLEYGGRFVNELKLETDELKPNSYDFLELLKGYLNFKINKTKRNPVILKYPLNLYLRKTKHYLRQREDLRILRAQVFSLTRNIFLRIGEILEKDKIIDSKKDVFYLEIKEIENYIYKDYKIDLKDLINPRKKQYKEFKQYSLPSVFYTNKLGKIIIPQKEINEDFKDVIMGRPCSVGEITGNVTLIKDSKPDLGKSYDIVVTESADPGWAPVLGLCKGIIIEKGGVLSHISILARELGVPCIINASDITKIVNNKDKIYMNGGNGKIKVIKDN